MVDRGGDPDPLRDPPLAPVADNARHNVQGGHPLPPAVHQGILRASLGANRNRAEFGFALATVRWELEHDNFYLSAQGQANNGYIILQLEENADVMLGYQKTDSDCLTGGVILGTNTKLERLTDPERRQYEAISARMAEKAALMQRKLPDGEDDTAAIT